MNNSQDENRCLVFNNFVEEYGKIWFWDTNYNALFQASIEGGFATCIWGIGYDKEGAGSLYSKILKCKSKIIGVPMFADNILVYDINTEEARLISIPIQEWVNMHTLERGRFWSGVVWENYVFMIGYWSEKVLKFDVVNESIVDVIDLYEGLDIPLEGRRLSFKNALVIDNKILIPGYSINCIFILDPNNMQYEKIVVEKSGDGFSDIAYDGEDVWLSPRARGQLVRWNVQEDKISLYDNYPADFHMVDVANISGMECCNGKVYVFPYKADKVFAVKKDGNDIEMYTEGAFNHYYENLCTHNEVMKYLFVKSIGNQLYSFCTESRRVLSYNTESGSLFELKFMISDEDYFYFSLKNKGIVEEDHGGLSLLVKILTDNTQKNNVNKKGISTILEKEYITG